MHNNSTFSKQSPRYQSPNCLQYVSKISPANLPILLGPATSSFIMRLEIAQLWMDPASPGRWRMVDYVVAHRLRRPNEINFRSFTHTVRHRIITRMPSKPKNMQISNAILFRPELELPPQCHQEPGSPTAKALSSPTLGKLRTFTIKVIEFFRRKFAKTTIYPPQLGPAVAVQEDDSEGEEGLPEEEYTWMDNRGK